MQKILCLTFLVLSFPTWATESYLRCSEVFSAPRQFFYDLDELNREVASTLSKIPTETMADTILYTAQNKIAYEGFSPELVNSLRRTLELLLESEMVQDLIELPYINETLRRLGQKPLQMKDMFGRKVDLDLFGIETPQEQTPLIEMDHETLSRAGRRASVAAKNLYLRQAQQEDLFLNIGLKRNLNKLLIQGQNFSDPPSETFDLEDRHDGEVIFSMFSSFLREALIREEVDKLIREGRLKWSMSQQAIDHQILLLAVYPELLPFIERLQEFEFPYSLELNSLENIHSTSYAVLGSGSAMGSLSLFKQTERVQKDYVQWLEASIEIVFLDPSMPLEDDIKVRRLAHLHSFLWQAWQEFLATHSYRANQLRLLLKGDDETLSLTVEAFDEEISEFEALAEFFLFIITEDRRDGYGDKL